MRIKGGIAAAITLVACTDGLHNSFNGSNGGLDVCYVPLTQTSIGLVATIQFNRLERRVLIDTGVHGISLNNVDTLVGTTTEQPRVSVDYGGGLNEEIAVLDSIDLAIEECNLKLTAHDVFARPFPEGLQAKADVLINPGVFSTDHLVSLSIGQSSLSLIPVSLMDLSCADLAAGDAAIPIGDQFTIPVTDFRNTKYSAILDTGTTASIFNTEHVNTSLPLIKSGRLLALSGVYDAHQYKDQIFSIGTKYEATADVLVSEIPMPPGTNGIVGLDLMEGCTLHFCQDFKWLSCSQNAEMQGTL